MEKKSNNERPILSPADAFNKLGESLNNLIHAFNDLAAAFNHFNDLVNQAAQKEMEDTLKESVNNE